MSYKEQYDGEDNMTLNAVPNRLDVCKALGVSRVAPFFNPANLNKKNRFIFFNLETHPILWENLHNKSTKPIDNSTRQLVLLLKQAELGGWVLLSRVNETKTRTNLVVIVEDATYRNIKNTYKPHKGLESFEYGNDESEEEEYTDPSNNDKGEDSRSKFVETSAARQDRVQDDSVKKFDTGDASKKRKTTGPKSKRIRQV